MPVSTVFSRAPVGLDAPLVRVEVHIGCGLPAFLLVGLPEAAVRESRERVRSALETAGLGFPSGRIIVNLSPADLPKEGGRFDLPIAVGILAASGQLSEHAVIGKEFYGELALNGELRETPRLLPAILQGIKERHELIVPAANSLEAALVAGSKIRLAAHLRDVCRALQGGASLPAPGQRNHVVAEDPLDLSDIRGQFAAKRALEIAAAGGHGLLNPLTIRPLEPWRDGPCLATTRSSMPAHSARQWRFASPFPGSSQYSRCGSSGWLLGASGALSHVGSAAAVRVRENLH